MKRLSTPVPLRNGSASSKIEGGGGRGHACRRRDVVSFMPLPVGAAGKQAFPLLRQVQELSSRA